MDINLDALAEQLNVSDSASSTPSPSETSTPVTQETSSEVRTEETTLPKTDTTVDDAIEVTFPDGTKEAIKRSELPNFVLRQRDYTNKTQQLASMRKKYEALEQNAPLIRQKLEFAQKMEQALASPEQLFQFAVEQVGPEKAIKHFMGLVGQNPQAYDPNDIPTYKETEDILNSKLSTYEQRMQQMEQSFEQRLQEAIEARLSQDKQETQYESERKTYETKFNKLINEQLTSHEELSAIENIEDILKYKTFTKIREYVQLNGYEPTFEQAAQWMESAAKEQVTKLAEKFGARKAASPLNNGIEPSGGNRPVSLNTERKSYYNQKTGEGDWDSLVGNLAKQIEGVGRL